MPLPSPPLGSSSPFDKRSFQSHALPLNVIVAHAKLHAPRETGDEALKAYLLGSALAQSPAIS